MNLHLTLAVDHLETSAAFYGGLLGLPVESLGREGRGEGLLLRLGENWLLLRPAAVLVAHHPALYADFDRSARGSGVTIEITLPRLDPVLRALERHDWRILYELEDDEHRRREIWCHDPDGYLVVLNQEAS